VFTKSLHWISWWISRIQYSPSTVFNISFNIPLVCDAVHSGRSVRWNGSFCLHSVESLQRLYTVTRLYGLTPETTGFIVSPLRTSHISHVLILTAHYAWSTDIWVRFIDKYWFRLSHCSDSFVTSAVLTQLLSCQYLFSNIQECRCTFGHLTHLIHK